MTTEQQKHSALKAEFAIAASIITLAAFVGMAAWLSQGDTLFWSAIEAGLAWCL